MSFQVQLGPSSFSGGGGLSVASVIVPSVFFSLFLPSRWGSVVRGVVASQAGPGLWVS